ncbi:MAG: cytidylate kinase family protein [Treponema sp.]|jgi:cytidylate kinase|nr:cytidylate kinase family protein [Treponema sp.]
MKKIAISGKSGCGNTTVSQLLAKELDIPCINFTFRNLAQELGLDLSDLLEKAQQDDSWDKNLDERQVSLARAVRNGCVLGSRLAIWLLPEADLKVYLCASALTRVHRIVEREGGDSTHVMSFTMERDRQDRERYKRIYGIDNDDYSFALVVDTDTMKPPAIVQYIIKHLP